MSSEKKCEESCSLVSMTSCLHGEGHDTHVLNAHAFPIFQTSTFVFDSADHGARLFAGEQQGHIYTRIGNPTVEEFEKVIKVLEKGELGIAFGSGMGVVTGCIFPFVSNGEHVVVCDTAYGPSINFVCNILVRYGISHTVVDPANLADVKAAIKPNTKVVYVETPANPTNKISDIAAVAELTHAGEQGKTRVLVVDNTFCSPVFQNPLKLGADVTLHSITKYINGHGDVVGGVAVAKDLAIGKLIKKWRTDTGAVLAPMDAFLALRGTRTLPLRMKQHHINGLAVAHYLAKHPKVYDIMHPGMPEFPGYEIAKKQQTGYGGTFSFKIKAGYEAAKKMIESCKMATLAVSLGCVDTLIEHPASMTHASVSEELMKQQGLTRDLVRISVGIEDVKDIIADLEQALEKI